MDEWTVVRVTGLISPSSRCTVKCNPTCGYYYGFVKWSPQQQQLQDMGLVADPTSMNMLWITYCNAYSEPMTSHAAGKRIFWEMTSQSPSW